MLDPNGVGVVPRIFCFIIPFLLHLGVYLLADGGYPKWEVLQQPVLGLDGNDPVGSAVFNAWLEASRKDVGTYVTSCSMNHFGCVLKHFFVVPINYFFTPNKRKF